MIARQHQSPLRLTDASAVAERRDLSRLSKLGVERFETWTGCAVRQREMLRRLDSEGYNVAKLLHLEECRAPGACDGCSEGCYFATRKRRLEGIQSAYDVLKDHPGPLYDVSIVHPNWERAVGDLHTTNIAAAVQWHYRRLAKLDCRGLIAVGIYEVSLNIELDGERFWAGEIHEVVAGADKDSLHPALDIERRYRKLRPNNKLLAITPVENLGGRLAYSMKRFVEQRCAYVTESTGRQARRHLPPRRKDWAEHDAWLLSLPIGARTIAYGCRRRGNRFIATA